MPYLTTEDRQIYYEEYGMGPETMVFCHGLFMNLQAFKPQLQYFKARYRCVALDLRGQGQSSVEHGSYHVEDLMSDVVHLIQSLQTGPCHLIGLSVGANVAIQLAREHRELVKSLALINANADEQRSKWRLGLKRLGINIFGVSLMINSLARQLFSSRFLEDELRQDELLQWKQEVIKNKRRSVDLLSAYINRSSQLPLLGELDMPTLIIAGEEDQIATADQSKNIKLKIPQARLAMIKDAGHCAPIEQSWQVVNTMEVFLNGVH